MTKPSVYRIQLHDGMPLGRALPPERGLFELRDAEWRLHFPHLESTIACGLLRADVEVRAVDRHRSLITLSGRDEPGFTLHLVVWARAHGLRADFEHRRLRLDQSRATLEAVQRGEWWRDDRVFERLGPLKTVSLTGVRYLGGLARTTRVKSTRITQVMDFGQHGIRLRGWRTHLEIPWEQIASIEVRWEDTPSEVGNDPERPAEDAPIIEVELQDGSKVRFAAPGATEDELHARLDPLFRCLEGIS
jgi:hypothetical protein